jgi:hypothetical protein
MVTKRRSSVITLDVEKLLKSWLWIIAFFLVAGFTLSHPVAALFIAALGVIILRSVRRADAASEEPPKEEGECQDCPHRKADPK